MRRRLATITALQHHLSPAETSAEEGGGVLEQPLQECQSGDEEVVMVIRLAAVEGDKFSGNSDSGVQHYEANQGPTDLSTANIQYVTDIIRIYNKGCTSLPDLQFLNIVQNAFDTPPPCFEHLVDFF